MEAAGSNLLTITNCEHTALYYHIKAQLSGTEATVVKIAGQQGGVHTPAPAFICQWIHSKLMSIHVNLYVVYEKTSQQHVPNSQ